MKNLTPNLMVSDVNATAEFYRQIFDFQIVTSVPDMVEPESGQWQFAILNNGDTTIMLQNKRTLIEDVPQFLNQPTGGTFTLYINVEDVRGLFEKVKSHVTLVKDDLYETFYGTTEFTICDPNGYILTFAEENIKQ